MAERNFAPESQAWLTGPKHPRQGVFVETQVLPHPDLVAGPIQMIPLARKQVSLSISTSWILFTSFISSLKGLVLFLSQASHMAICGEGVVPLGGSLPLKTAETALRIRSGGGGHPGR